MGQSQWNETESPPRKLNGPPAAWPKFFEIDDWNLGFRKPWNPVEASRLARGPTAAPHFRASFRAFHFLPVDPAWQGTFLNSIDLIHAGMYPLRNLANGSEWIIPPLAQGRICSNPSGFLRGQVFGRVIHYNLMYKWDIRYFPTIDPEFCCETRPNIYFHRLRMVKVGLKFFGEAKETFLVGQNVKIRPIPDTHKVSRSRFHLKIWM